jgi:hypothetical protein
VGKPFPAAFFPQKTAPENLSGAVCPSSHLLFQANAVGDHGDKF